MSEIKATKRLSNLLLLLTCAAFSVTAAAASPQEFTSEMYERIVAAEPASRLEVKADLELLTDDDQLGKGVINLHRIYGFCQQASPEDCEKTKQEFVDNLTAQVPESELPSLRIIVRNQQYFDYLAKDTGFEKLDINLIPHRKIGEDLYAFLAFDSPNTIALVTKETLHNLKTGEQKAWDLAEKQTREILPAFPTSDQIRESPIELETEEYLASLLAFQGDWLKLSNQVGENLFVTATSDQFVMVALGSDVSDMDAFKRSVVEDCNQQQRCISPNIYRFSGGQWVIEK